MTPLQELYLVLTEILSMDHAEDWKVLASFTLFLIATITATIVFGGTVGSRRRTVNSRRPEIRPMLWALAMVFYCAGFFGLVRTLDGIADTAFLLATPNAMTTLSQQTLVLEIPLIIFNIAIAVFLYLYIKIFLKMMSEEQEQNQE